MPRSEPRPDVFRAIADPTRRRILDRLRAGPIGVTVIAASFPQSRPAISKHLRVLREAGVVEESRSGRERQYRINPEAMRGAADWIEGYRRLWQANLDGLKRYLEEEGP